MKAIRMYRHIWKTLTSLRLSLWGTALVALSLLAGAIFPPGDMGGRPLFAFMLQEGPGRTWWMWSAVFLLGVLALNTIACSIDSLVKKASRFPLLIAPQIIHFGFLLMLVAHLFSSCGSLRMVAAMPEGGVLQTGDNNFIRISHMKANISAEGYLTGYRAKVEFISPSGRAAAMVGPNKPAFNGGLGVYLKDLQTVPYPAALIEVSREPGAIWALAGSILFTVGTVMLLILKMRRQ